MISTSHVERLSLNMGMECAASRALPTLSAGSGRTTAMRCCTSSTTILIASISRYARPRLGPQASPTNC